MSLDILLPYCTQGRPLAPLVQSIPCRSSVGYSHPPPAAVDISVYLFFIFFVVNFIKCDDVIKKSYNKWVVRAVLLYIKYSQGNNNWIQLNIRWISLTFRGREHQHRQEQSVVWCLFCGVLYWQLPLGRPNFILAMQGVYLSREHTHTNTHVKFVYEQKLFLADTTMQNIIMKKRHAHKKTTKKGQTIILKKTKKNINKNLFY